MPADRDKIAGFGFRRGQPAVFQNPVRLLHGAQTDTVFDAQGAYRRQTVAGPVKAVFDARAEQFGKIDVERHGVLSNGSTLQGNTDQPKI
ncbi:Cupin domain protein related to quercetin dioxygenase [Pseudomonas syringae pv. actinidiae]|uniref:Cupin domain protein related to quercetin dioxygenase n=1 Tax=Pseudomonas syringae pv. actinidiae TaxID=103796 RepID=A0A2V0Q457_PSESF|nr:Cupin domain protein related to quercetin dioxygenase [Pseudomonas syringae pv. actinidiae]